MMKLQLLFILAILVVGIGMGINLARDKPLLSNPFEDKTVAEKARDKARDAAEGLLKKLD